MSKKTFYGGQAVIEGVMMRGKKNLAVAVRHPNGGIVTHTEKLNGPIYTSKIAKLPFIRGLTMLWDALVLGVRMLLFSANVAVSEEDAEITPMMTWGMLAVALVFSIGLFFVLPLMLISWLDTYLDSSFVSNVIEGIVRLVIFMAYIVLISLAPDIKRVFAYHGAEHKAINAYEAGEELVVENVQKYPTSHPRCGTGFLLIVMTVSILVFALLGRPPLIIRTISRIALVPVIAGISYELLRYSAEHIQNRIVKAIFAPGLALQSLTTRQPDDSQVEVAISALKATLAADAVEAEAAGVRS